MRQPTILERKRRGVTTFYCELGGQQRGLGVDPNEARVKFADLLAKHHGRQELLPVPAAVPAEPKPALKVRAVLLMFLEWCKANRAHSTFKFYFLPLASETSDEVRAKRKKQRKESTNFASFDVWLRRKGLAELLVSDFGPSHVDDWIADHFANRSDTYRHNLIRTVQAAFNWAMDRKELRRQIGEHPLTGLKKPAQSPREGYINSERWAKIETTVRDEFLDLLVVIKETGCRPQEARMVEAKHLDREGRRWYFADPIKKVRGKKEPRIVHLTARAFEICQRLAMKHPTGPIFRNEGGMSWNKAALNSRCQRLREKLGFNLCVYSLRHTFCTDALKRGVDPLTVAKLMGHKNASMVMNVYNRLGECQDHLRDALRKISG